MVSWDQQLKILGNVFKRLGRLGYCAHADESGKGHRLNKLAPKTRRGAFLRGVSRGKFWGLGGLIFHQKSGECHDIQRKQIKINFLKIKCTNIIILLLLSRAKPGNPASQVIKPKQLAYLT